MINLVDFNVKISIT